MSGTGRRVLVCDDEIQILRALRVVLRDAGFEVVSAQNVHDALDLASVHPPDAAILDLVLPDGTGIDVCRELRTWSAMPILILSAVGDEDEKVRALEAGADDYVVKPFSPRELVARVRAQLRRRSPSAQTPWVVSGAFEIDRDGRRARYRGQRLDLTRYEYGLLEALLERPGAVLSRAQLMDRVWSGALESGDRTVDTHVKTLRAKLRAVGGEPAEAAVRTHRGIGYSLEVDG